MFDEVELSLSEPDGWTDYDEKVRAVSPPNRAGQLTYVYVSQSSVPVSVMEFESKIERA